ncbi:DivIVA domain-containing protein [Microlunatus parietis]|uniref:Cell wall synthesis protein Wag31 n=1 Tax=Microlunatus parietis TaxID=682979 RepID=A0A7Y9LCI5_9ACTN|nr:DivIVA domain-containing protein [Microlunatus parietis]NYE74879.1 DivIVA domain-containing protein [Microlunatus parietis]
MTLSLDDVRNKRFRMARKSGYEVLEVDEFVDEVEEAFAQLIEENKNLKKQIESLRAAPVQDPAASDTTILQPAAQPDGKQTLVVTTGKEASAAVVRLVELSTEQAERLVSEAEEDANRIREEANRSAHQVTTDARTRAERVESEARVNAERVQSDATARAAQLDREIEQRRIDMFSELERQRDQLSNSVRELRNFEANFRSNLTGQLRRHIDTLEASRAEPVDTPQLVRDLDDKPEPRSMRDNSQKNGTGPSPYGSSVDNDSPTLGGGSPTSDTPRLDALLGDQR